jgi:hypothetical protein
VFETYLQGDIIVSTDGHPYRGGILYRVDFERPGRFASDLDAEVTTADQVERTRTDNPTCE